MTSPRPTLRRRRAALLLVIAAPLAFAGWKLLAPAEEAAYDGPVALVERRPLTISVNETGTLEARDKVVLECEIDARSTTITFIVSTTPRPCA